MAQVFSILANRMIEYPDPKPVVVERPREEQSAADNESLREEVAALREQVNSLMQSLAEERTARALAEQARDYEKARADSMEEEPEEEEDDDDEEPDTQIIDAIASIREQLSSMQKMMSAPKPVAPAAVPAPQNKRYNVTVTSRDINGNASNFDIKTV